MIESDRQGNGRTVVNIRLNPHSEQLLKEQLAHGGFHSPEEVIERALEAFAQRKSVAAGEGQREAVRDMLDFVKQNRVRLETGLSVKDLIHEGHRV
jgi:Arc/MetJ-type ribon-helix-helix transcriptional regulator